MRSEGALENWRQKVLSDQLHCLICVKVLLTEEANYTLAQQVIIILCLMVNISTLSLFTRDYLLKSS